MHVKYIIMLALGLAACSRAAEKKPIHVDVSFPDATPTLPADSTPTEYVMLAKNALEAIKTLASKCRLHRYEESDFDRIVDDCGIWKATDVAAVTNARKALDASPLAPETGFLPALVRQIDAFDDWSSKLWKDEQGYWARVETGTLFKYQEMATTWNDWRPPSDAVPVYVWQQGDVVIDAGAGGKLHWKHCSNGPCIVIDKEPKERR